jgi:chemotaxis protein methyltransferase CheR
MALRQATPARVTPTSFAYLQGVVLRRTGTILEHGKEYLVEARLFALAQSEGFASVEALLEGLQTEEESGDLHRRVTEAMLNYETSFFRDHYPFEALRQTLLPNVISRRESTRQLDIWCAGIASGQEVYSLAMMLREHFPALAGWKVKLLASDVSESMLERARSGEYSQVEVNRGLPARLLVKYFQRAGNRWRLNADLRRMVELQRFNLAASWPGVAQADLVFLRNVLLYFHPEVRRTILAQVARVLREDGYLFLGGGETTLITDRTYEPVRVGKALCYRLRPNGVTPGSTTGESRP